jgi:hypothetical protein
MIRKWFDHFLVRHTRESGYPVFSAADWIPAFAGMTESKVRVLLVWYFLCPKSPYFWVSTRK